MHKDMSEHRMGSERHGREGQREDERKADHKRMRWGCVVWYWDVNTYIPPFGGTQTGRHSATPPWHSATSYSSDLIFEWDINRPTL